MTMISDESQYGKLNACAFDIKSLIGNKSLFHLAYFTNRKQKTKTGSSFSDFLNILFGALQGSVLGPLLFIIYKCDLFTKYDAIEFAI